MKKTNLLITILMVMVMVAIMPIVIAGMTSPVAFGNYTGTMTATVTVLSNNNNNMTNVTCFYNQTGGTANTVLVQILNTSSDQTTFTSAPAISSLTDAVTYNITCRVYNGTSLNETLTVANITFDSTDPICDLTRKYGQPAYKGIQELTWSSSDALSLVSTAITIDRPQTGADMSYTDASKTLTLLSTDTPYIGDWTATVLATDRAGNTATCTEEWKTYLPNGDNEDYYDDLEKSSNNTGIVVGLVIIGGLIWFFTKKN